MIDVRRALRKERERVQQQESAAWTRVLYEVSKGNREKIRDADERRSRVMAYLSGIQTAERIVIEILPLAD